jgi:hypothetical protein
MQWPGLSPAIADTQVGSQPSKQFRGSTSIARKASYNHPLSL